MMQAHHGSYQHNRMMAYAYLQQYKGHTHGYLQNRSTCETYDMRTQTRGIVACMENITSACMLTGVQRVIARRRGPAPDARNGPLRVHDTAGYELTCIHNMHICVLYCIRSLCAWNFYMLALPRTHTHMLPCTVAGVLQACEGCSHAYLAMYL